MAIGTVIVPAFDPKGVQQAVSAALPFVESQGAHLVGLHLRERYPASQVPEYNWHAAVLKEFEAGVAARADRRLRNFPRSQRPTVTASPIRG